MTGVRPGALLGHSPGLWTPPGALASAPLSAYDAAVLADNPVAYWPFNETSGTTAADLGSGGNTGTFTGGVTLNQAGAVTGGKSILLNGTSGYVDVPDKANLRLTAALTLEAWANPTDLTSFWFLLCKDVGSSANPYEFRIAQTTGKPEAILTGPTPTAGTTAVTAGAWNHLVVTYGSGTITHYLNGAANGSGASPAGTDGATALKIGTRNDLFTFFKGRLANPAIYGTTLSAARVLAHWNAR